MKTTGFICRASLVAVVVAFDTKTGDVLHTHQKIVETVDGKPVFRTEITPDECEEIRADLARALPRRRVGVIVAPPEMGPREGERIWYHVDPKTRKMRKLKVSEPEFEGAKKPRERKKPTAGGRKKPTARAR